MLKNKRVHNVDSILLDYYAKRANLNSTEIADRLGISAATYLNKRNGYTGFLASEMFKLIEILKIPDEDVAQIFNPKDIFLP